MNPLIFSCLSVEEYFHSLGEISKIGIQIEAYPAVGHKRHMPQTK
jgi:hypothetical protein